MTPRLLCQLQDCGGKVTVSAQQGHYLLKVLRLEIGDAVQIFDGQGLRFEAKICHIDSKTVQLLAQPGIRSNEPRPHQIWLLQGLPTGDKMDWIIEKAVEIGVSRLSPMECERSIVKLHGPRLVKKMAHWRSEIEAACMQSQRDILMALDEVQTSEVSFSRLGSDAVKLLLTPGATLSLLDAIRTRRNASLPSSHAGPAPELNFVIAIGPESGFSDRERLQAKQAGFVEVNLGQQILRTETAALVATSKLQAWLELL